MRAFRSFIPASNEPSGCLRDAEHLQRLPRGSNTNVSKQSREQIFMPRGRFPLLNTFPFSHYNLLFFGINLAFLDHLIWRVASKKTLLIVFSTKSAASLVK